MKIIFLIMCIAVFALASSTKEDFIKTQFSAFKLKWAKNYKSDEEELMRFKIFKQNLKKIAQLNAVSKNYGINQFTDLTSSEFSHLYLMPKRPAPEIHDDKLLNFNMTGAAPAEWDWRKDGLKNGVSAITPVYNQGQCGSCWAFSATEQTESMDFLNGNAGSEPKHLSMQQVVDCDTKAYGCEGGWTYVAYEYIMQCGGYDSLESYPYTAKDGKCDFKKQGVEAKIKSYNYVTKDKNEGVMKDYVGTTGPVSICVDAESWQYYNGGVIKSC